MQIEYRVGSLINTEIPYIVHGCNAQGKMNSGVAKLLRETYPQVYDNYIHYCLKYRHKRQMLGSAPASFIRTAQPGGLVIFNAITQLNYGQDGKRYVSYDAIDEAFQYINRFIELNPLEENDVRRLALPLIGAGLGGGRWKVISSIIEEACTAVQPVVYTLDGNIPL